MDALDEEGAVMLRGITQEWSDRFELAQRLELAAERAEATIDGGAVLAAALRWLANKVVEELCAPDTGRVAERID